jgi:hypothetical protein
MFNFPSNGGLPGFRVGRPDDLPGFNINQDGSVGRFADGPSNAPDDNALQTTALRTGFGSAGTIASEPSGVISVKLYLGWRHVELYDAARKDPSPGAGTCGISGYRSR